jgi:hypothetical protein
MALNSEQQKLNRDDIIEFIQDPDSDGDISDSDQSDSDVYDNDLHEEEEQPDTSNQRVYRWGRTMKQAHRGVNDYNKDEGSDSDETLLPHRNSGTMAWTQQTPGFISSLVINLAKDKMWHPIAIMTWIQTVFSCCTLQQFLVCWWTRTTPTIDSTWDKLDKRHPPVPDITESEILFLALIVQMVHDV